MKKQTVLHNATLPTYGTLLGFAERNSGISYTAMVQQMRLDPQRVQVFGEGFGFRSMLITEFDKVYLLMSGQSLQETIEQAAANYMARKVIRRQKIFCPKNIDRASGSQLYGTEGGEGVMNEKLIEHFKIKSDNSRLPRIFLQSDEGTARRLRECLYAHRQFWFDITLNHYDFPVVLIIVDCVDMANVYDFLGLEAVRRVLIESIGEEVRES